MPLTDTLTAADQATSAVRMHHNFNIDVGPGMTAGSIVLQRQYFGRDTWRPVATYTAEASEIGNEIEGGVDYRLVASSDFAGSVDVRLGGGQ